MNGNADLMSRLPLPATEADNHPDIRLSGPAVIDAYMIGASGVQSQQQAKPLCLRSDKLEDQTSSLYLRWGRENWELHH